MSLNIGNDKSFLHPVDLVEEVAHGHNWSFERIAQDEISLLVAGEWSDYDVSFSWLDTREMLHIACGFSLSVPDERLNEIYHLLAQINSKLPMGHFEYWPDSGRVLYRHTLLLTGEIVPSDKQVEALLLHALEACEAHYQPCHIVCWSGASARQALSYVLFETVGNA